MTTSSSYLRRMASGLIASGLPEEAEILLKEAKRVSIEEAAEQKEIIEEQLAYMGFHTPRLAIDAKKGQAKIMVPKHLNVAQISSFVETLLRRLNTHGISDYKYDRMDHGDPTYLYLSL